jgi:hypothetical protein
MATKSPSIRTCIQGHSYTKSSDCPVCPICASEDKPDSGWLAGLSAPARRALLGEDIVTEEDLAQYSLKEILALHGMGPKSVPLLVQALKNKDLSFKPD